MTKLKIMPHAVGAYLKGVGVESVELDAHNHFIVYLDNGETVDAGEFKVDDALSSTSSRPLANKTIMALKGALETMISRTQESIDNRINALVGNNATTAIDNFNEIISFFEGVTDSETLVAKIAEINASIAAEQSRVNDELASKVDKVEGKGLSTNDYTNEDKAQVIISKKNRDIQVASGYYNTAALGSIVSAKTESSGYVCAIVPALVGSTYEFAGIGTTGAAQLIFTLDRNKRVVRNANSLGVAANTASAQTITIQEGEKYIGYNSTVGGYNTQGIFRLCDNVVNVEEILRNELRKIEESGDNAPNDISVSGWIDGRYLYQNGLASGVSDNYKCTDFIEVQPLRKIRITNAFTTDYSAVHFYDNAQMHVGRLEINAQTGVFSGDVDIPANCRYIRYSIRVAQLTTNTIEYVDTKPNYYLSNKLVNGWFEQSFQKTETLFKSAADRPILTIIDDDTPSSEGINRLVGLCDDLGVKCTFATLTRQFELHPEMPDTIKALERRGYHFAIHGYSQHSAYQDADNNVAICEDDLVRGLQDMHQAGAMDFKYWVTPFGAQSDTMKRLAKKWGMNCMITTKEGVETTRASQGKWAITRCGLNRTDAESDITLEALKGLIDECVSVNGWMLLCTHIANGWAGNDYSRFNEIVNYAKNAGCDIMPLNEAWNKRKPIYDFYENF